MLKYHVTLSTPETIRVFANRSGKSATMYQVKTTIMVDTTAVCEVSSGIYMNRDKGKSPTPGVGLPKGSTFRFSSDVDREAFRLAVQDRYNAQTDRLEVGRKAIKAINDDGKTPVKTNKPDVIAADDWAAVEAEILTTEAEAAKINETEAPTE